MHVCVHLERTSLHAKAFERLQKISASTSSDTDRLGLNHAKAPLPKGRAAAADADKPVTLLAPSPFFSDGNRWKQLGV